MKLTRLFCLLMALCLVLALASCHRGIFTDKLDETLNGGDGSDSDGSGDDGSGDDGSDGTDIPEIDYSSYSDGLEEGGLFEGVTALDIVALPDYASMEPLVIEKLYDRPIADGDFINIDYVGSIDGVEFDGGSTRGQGSDIIVGKTSFIDDFIEQLIGHTPGENFDIEVTFPESYQSEDLAGKDAVFNITVNHIWDVSDDIAVQIGFDSMDTMGTYIASNYSVAVEDLAADSAMNRIYAGCSFGDIPESVTETIRNLVTLQLQEEAAAYGLDADTLATLYGYDSAAGYAAAVVEDQTRWSLMVQAIAENEGIEVTADTVTEAGFDDYVELYGAPFVHFTILNNLVNSAIDDYLS